MPLPDAEGVAPSNPKELISAYLLSKGQQPTNALMSQALMANAQNPGLIPGLRNMEPVSSPGDPGQPPAPSKGGGGGGTARVPPAARTKDDAYTPTPAAGGDDLLSSLLYSLPLVGGALYAGKKLGGRFGSPQEPAAPADVAAPKPTGRSTIPEAGRGATPPAEPAPVVEPNLPLKGGGAVTGGAGDPAMELAMQKALEERKLKLFGNLEAPRSLRANSPAPDIAMPEPPVDPAVARNTRNAQVIEDRMWPKNAPTMVSPNPPGSAATVKDKLLDILTGVAKGVTPDPSIPSAPRSSVPRAARPPRL